MPPSPPSGDPPAGARRLGSLRKLLFTAIVLVVVFAGAELALRAVIPVIRTATLPNEEIQSHLRAAGFRYHPDLYWYWRGLPSPSMQINRFGFRRTKPMERRKPAGVTRVVVLGDSQTLGAGVGPDQTYAHYAELALGEGWEVLNAGISGYRSLNALRLLQLRILYFEPDIVVIDCMPFDSPRDDGFLEDAPLGSPLQRLKPILWHSRVYYGLRLLLEKLRPDRARWLDQKETELAPNAQGHGNHDLIGRWGDDNGVQVVFMEYPVSTDDWRLSCHTRPGELPEGYPVAPTCQALYASRQTARDLFQDRNHMKAAGNRIVGQALAETLRPLRR